MKVQTIERPAIHQEDGVPRVMSAAVRTEDGKDAFIVLIPLNENP